MGRTRRNVLSNWFSLALRLLIGLWLTPFVVGHLGKDAYGLWVLLSSIGGYFDLLDLGVRSALVRYVAQARALGDKPRLVEIARRAMGAAATASGVALVLFLVLGAALRGFLENGVSVRPGEVPVLVGLVAGTVASGFLVAYFTGLLSAAQRYDLSNAVSVGAAVARAAAVVLILRSDGGLVGLAGAGLATTLLQAVAMFWAARREYPDLPFRPAAPLGPVARSLIGYGAASLLLQGAVRIAFHTDNIVIAAFLTKSAVATFAIAGTLIAYLRQIVGAMTNVLTPQAAEMDARGDLPGLRALLERGTTLCLALSLPVLATFLLDRGLFIRLWVGPSFDASGPVLRVLALGQLVALPQLAAGVILYGMNRHMRNALIAVAEALANLALSIVLVRAVGLIGVAWGTAAPLLVTQTLILPRYVCSLLRMSPWTLFTRSYLPAAGAGVVYAAVFRGAIWAIAPQNLLSYLACVGIALAPYVLLVFRFVLDGGTRRALLTGWRGAEAAP